MRCTGSITIAAALLSWGSGPVSAQTAAPAAPAQPVRVVIGTPITGPMPHPALVLYSEGQLEVRARNSSLNQILNDVARKTGLKITGTVNEDHIFGSYGPASPATVLTTLLQGSGSNMLLRVSSSGAPAELILTPRPDTPAAPAACTEGSCSNATSPANVQVSTGDNPGPPITPLHPFPAMQPAGAPSPQGAAIMPPPALAPGDVDPATGQTVWPQHHVVQQQTPQPMPH